MYWLDCAWTMLRDINAIQLWCVLVYIQRHLLCIEYIIYCWISECVTLFGTDVMTGVQRWWYYPLLFCRSHFGTKGLGRYGSITRVNSGRASASSAKQLYLSKSRYIPGNLVLFSMCLVHLNCSHQCVCPFPKPGPLHRPARFPPVALRTR